MSRLCRLALLVVCAAGIGSPSSTEAGVATWMSTSMLAQSTAGQFWGGYTSYYSGPYYTGYSGYYGSSYYGPYSAGYAPGIGCSTCQSSYGYASVGYGNCNCSPCASGNCGTGCASGNCSSGCATTTNSTPSGSLQPVADPNNSARNIENRLDVIERALNITPPRNKTYAPDGFNSVPNRNRTNDANRNRTNENDGFEQPNNANPDRNRDGEMFPENRGTGTGTGSAERAFKPATETIAIPGNDDGTVIQSKKPAPGGSIDEPEGKKKDQSLRMDSRVTSRPVSPRERQGGVATAVVQKRTARTLQVDAQPGAMNVARQ